MRLNIVMPSLFESHCSNVISGLSIGISLTTKFKETNIAVNPDRFNLNRTFEIGDDTQIKVGGEVDFDGESKGKIDFTKDFLNKKVQIYGGADTKGDFEVGTKFKFLNL